MLSSIMKTWVHAKQSLSGSRSIALCVMLGILMNAYIYEGSLRLAPILKALTATPGLLPSNPLLPPHPSLPYDDGKRHTCLFLPCIWKAAAAGAQAASKQSNGAKARVGGKDAFVLYDTYGFPLEITQELAAAQSVDVDVEGFTQEMQVCFPSCPPPPPGGTCAWTLQSLWQSTSQASHPTHLVQPCLSTLQLNASSCRPPLHIATACD